MTATQNPPRVQTTPPGLPPQRSRSPLQLVVDVLASMKLTVVLLLFFGVLTFAGTLAQKDQGLFVVQRDYFESLFVRWDTGIELGGGLVLKIPLPGGYLILATLFVNLMVGGVARLRVQLRNAGILVAHLGIALLLIAGFVKMHYSYSGHVALYEARAGQGALTQTSSMVSFHDYELALLRQDGDRLYERTIAEADLQGARRGIVTIADPSLPFTVEVSNWLDNCRPTQKGPMFQVQVPVVTDAAGVGAFLREEAVVPERERNLAGCYVKVTERVGRREHDGIVWGADFRPYDDKRFPFSFEVGGTTWGLDLRRVTWELPFQVRLDRFEKSDHPGTMTPKDFSSWVTVKDGNGERPAHIYMNNPLRRDGYVFFQTNWGPQPNSGQQGPPWFSVFEVAHNPSDDWPKYASYVILVGLLAHFLNKLIRYLRSTGHRANLPELS